MEKKTKQISDLLFTWEMVEKAGMIEDYIKEYDPIFEISDMASEIRFRMQRLGLKLRIPSFLYHILCICTNDDYQFGQLILKDIFANTRMDIGLYADIPYIIMTDDFKKTFPDKYPILEDPDMRARYEDALAAQRRVHDGRIIGNKYNERAFWES